jgi:pimeloyl-ACP methyl ester carboxylesterase
MWNFYNLEEKFKCILIDLPGHGKTKLNSDATVSMSSMAKDVIKIIDRYNLFFS